MTGMNLVYESSTDGQEDGVMEDEKEEIFIRRHQKSALSMMPFENLTSHVLTESDATFERGYSTYDLISRTLHQLARDGNHKMLALSLDRLGEEAPKRINQLDDQKLAPLHYAARYAHPFSVITLLQRKAKVNIKGQFGLTPLHCAARYRKSYLSAKKRRTSKKTISDIRSIENGDIANERSEDDESQEIDEETDKNRRKFIKSHGQDNILSPSLNYDECEESVVKILVENGADVNSKDIYGMTPLHYAAMRGHDVAANDLLMFEQINIEAKDRQQMTPLSVAATFGNVDVCRVLVGRGAVILTRDESRQTPLHRAAAEGHLDILKLLIESVSENGEKEVEKVLALQDWERQTPLHLAVSNGNIETTQYLLSHGADVSIVRDTLATPLHAAATNGNIEIILMLLNHGANVDGVDSNLQTALHKAAANNETNAIKVLKKFYANIEHRDKDSFTPLLLAASAGHAEVISTLLLLGARPDVIDKDDRTPVMWCAQQGHFEALKVLLEDPRAHELVDLSDSFDNSPLHEAARNGFVEVVKVLLASGSVIDNKNEDEETALHIAAENGQTEVVKELLKSQRFLINDENEDGNSALHLAALNGKTDVVEVLLKAGADVEARNTMLWTPLDVASANGHVTVCNLLIDYDSPIDPLDKTKTTPLQLACRNGYVEVVKLLLDKGASVSARDSTGKNALEIAITSFQNDVAISIMKSSQWLGALRNVRNNALTGKRHTPFRMLISQIPEAAKIALDRCIETNGKESDATDYGLKFNFEFIDDTYAGNNDSDHFETSSICQPECPYDSKGKLLQDAEPYTSNGREIRKNHPLNLMVHYKRSELLGHPVTIALLKHKWNSYTKYLYYFNLIFYIVFLSFLTGYVCIATDIKYAAMKLEEKNVSLPTTKCIEIQNLLDLRRPSFMATLKWIIIVMTIINIFRELFQIFQARINYVVAGNLLEWITYLGALFLVTDWSDSVSGECFLKKEWQWQIGAVVIFLAWMNLVLFLRKLPLFGIYVVMFTDVFTTFSRFFVVFFLFIVGFALSFFMIFRTQTPFEHVGSAMLKTSVMMIGEFEFDSIFNNENKSNLQYPAVSYFLFVIFVVVMSIIIMNLLVGLAVDDIKAVQEQAVLKRRAMQTTLIMDVEVLIPENLRRRFARSHKKFYPNLKKSKLRSIFSDFPTLHSFDYTQINEDDDSHETDISKGMRALQDQIHEIKIQNAKTYSLFSTALAFNKRVRRLESAVFQDDQE